jgi:hypothetical protein
MTSARLGRGVPLWSVLLAGGLVALVLAALCVAFLNPSHGPGRSPCVANLHHLAMALRMYALEHDNRFPPADRWCDALYPTYITSRSGFVCPARPDLASGYAMNARLGGLDVRTLAHEDRTILLFESDRGRNASGGPEAVTRTPRHEHGMVYYLALDGAVSGPDGGKGRLQWTPDLKPKPD